MFNPRYITYLYSRCHVCPKTFRVKKSLLQHLEKFHQDTSGYTQPRPGSPQSSFKAHSVKGSPSVASTSIPSVSSASVSITPKTSNSSLTSLGNNSVLSNKLQKSSKPTYNHNSENRNPLLNLATSQKLILQTNRDSLLKSTSNNDKSVAGSQIANPVTCPTCEKSFSRQSVLNVHSQMVHGAASSIKSLNKTGSILAAVKQAVVSSMATGAAMSPVDCTSVGSNFEAQFSLRSIYWIAFWGSIGRWCVRLRWLGFSWCLLMWCLIP